MDSKKEHSGERIVRPRLALAYVKGIAIGLLFLAAFLHFSPSFSSVPLLDPEQVILKALETNLAGNWSKKYTAESHLAGTNFGLVEWTKEKFEEYGFESYIDTYDTYLSYPIDHGLSLLDKKSEKVLYKAPLKEDALKKDSTSQGNDTVPTFLGYAANGNVTAEYVYVNYGTEKDFEKLKELGVDVTGKIAVVRYGAIFRGLKVKFAQEAGAVAVLIYSDPAEDNGITPANGFKQYPDGPARHESSVQRGSVQFLGGKGAAPGDPTTPGYASKPGVERQDPHSSIGKIPALPISYREVTPILKKLNGQGIKAPKEWRGELEGYDYSIGPNANVTLNLYNEQNFTITPIWNVYGEIRGENHDEAIIIGNHRDAWIKGGAGDPNSGSATLLEIARALGELKKAGYKFKRSIILQSWDGEEYGLLGSTEYGEFAAKDLQRNVVAYLNLDAAVTGKHLRLSGSPVLNELLLDVAKRLEYPEDGEGSLYDHFIKETKGRIPNLGSGSDYTVFLEHLGIPSVDFGYSNGKNDSVYQYHSNYDSYHWISTFADPGFVFHNSAAKYLSFLSLELSSKEVIKFGLNDYAKDLLKYFKEAVHEIPKEWFKKEIESESVLNQLLTHDFDNSAFIDEVSQGYYPTDTLFPHPEFLAPRQCSHNKVFQMYDVKHHRNLTLGDLVHKTFHDLKQLKNITEIFDSKSKDLQVQYDNKDLLPFWKRIKLHFLIKHHNKLTQYFERAFLYKEGLYERNWFKHVVFASGRHTGYAGQTWPGVREATEDLDFDRLVKWIGIAAVAVKRVSVSLAV